MKKIFTFLFVLILSATLVACNKDDNTIKIGILQYVTHQDLDDARIGFVNALAEAGFSEKEKNIKIEVLNPQADATVMQQQSAKLVRSSDLILAIATPAAFSVVTEAKAKGKNIPIFFTAVTDPVEAKLVTSLTNHNSNVTGTSDLTPIKDQIGLVKELKPNATKVGILYTSSEPNSEVQANIAAREIENLGLEAVVKTITSVTDINPVFNNLVTNNKVDAIYIPSDNLLSSSIGVLNQLNTTHKDKQVPIIASTTFQVKEGAAITLGLSYLNLGFQTGQMAVKVLNGTDIKSIDVETISTLELVINKKTLVDILQMTISEELLNRADIVFE